MEWDFFDILDSGYEIYNNIMNQYYSNENIIRQFNMETGKCIAVFKIKIK